MHIKLKVAFFLVTLAFALKNYLENLNKQQAAKAAAGDDSASGTMSNVVSFVKNAGLLVGGLASVLAVVIYWHQESLLYYPSVPGLPKSPNENPSGYKSPKDHNIPFENVTITTSDNIKIHAWLLKQTSPKRFPTVVFFHGNAGNIGFRLPNCSEMFRRLRVNILMVEYRGYGNSEGSPTEDGLMLDGEASIDYLLSREDINPKTIVVMGRSLGGAVAIALGQSRGDQVAAVIVENTFMDISSMVDEVMPQIAPLKRLVLRMKWSNHERIGTLEQPVLFLSGAKDELVPPRHMKQLYDLAKKSKSRVWYSVAAGKHNDTWQKGGKAYYDKILAFLRQSGLVAGDETSQASIDASDDSVHQPGYIPSMLDQPLFRETRGDL